ncbi:MAG: T9SS type A sorting domain-containing protein [Saprospiraceae bacterium]|nr:T9SS type A sorting domain-containing protein [Saprospiraceae bacterium]
MQLGSKTYRVYANLATNYNLISMYGGPVVPGLDVDSLVFFSSTNFWNLPRDGVNFARSFSDNSLDDGAHLIDSWFSFGGGGGSKRAWLKTSDTDGGVAGTPLTNSGGGMGSPLTTHDGRFNGAPNALTPAANGADLEATPYDVFYNATVGNRFSTTGLPAGFSINAGGSAATGPDASNRVLLGQFTTTGAFGYHINLQLGTPTPGVSETWVASSPQSGEFTHPSLILVPNTPPTCAITTPATNISVITGTSVTIVATAADTPPGTIAQVEFFDGVTSLAVDNTTPYEYTYTATVTRSITAVATDNQGSSTTSNVRVISVGANQPPVVVVSATPTSVVVTNNVTLSAPTLSDPDGTVASLQYYYRTTPGGAGTAIGALLTATPWTQVWTTPNVAGTYYVYGVATDNLGLSTTSANFVVTVVANTPPSVSIAIPTPLPITAPTSVTINATANDVDGTITNVKFFVNGVLVGSDNTGPNPYTFNWTSTPGFKNFTARAFDNNGDSITSNLISIEIIDPAGAPYRVGDVNQTCIPETFCMPIISAATLDNVIGYDVIINYDKTKVEATGNVIVRNLYVDSTLVEVVSSIESANGKMNFSAYFRSNAPSTTEFNGVANQTVFCVEFTKLYTFLPVDTVEFTVSKLQESYANGILLKSVDQGDYITYRDSLFDSSLKFWTDNSPIAYTPGVNLITNIFGTDASCGNKASVGTTPDANGNFVHNINKGRSISIERDIASGTSVQPVVNGADALLVRRLLINDVSLRPNVYQIIAMDVNLDGVISAGDASQINQRSVLILPEFKQAWNYNASGQPITPAQLSKDWLFLQSAITSTPAFGISTTFPNDNGVGYSKQRVPSIAFCAPTPVSDFATCPIIGDEFYKGIMLGDVNGSFQNIAPSVTLRTVGKVIYDLGKAVKNADNTVDVPVRFSSSEEVFALDFAMNFNEDKMSFDKVVTNLTNVQALSHLNTEDRTLRFTSNSLNKYETNVTIASVRFNLVNGEINKNDLENVTSYINGELVETEVLEGRSKTELNTNVAIYPNPTLANFYVESIEDANVQMYDLSGRQVGSTLRVSANQSLEVNTDMFNSGVYVVKVSNDHFVATKSCY